MLTFLFLFCIFSVRVPGSLPSSGRGPLGTHTSWIFLWILAVRCEGYLFLLRFLVGGRAVVY